MSDCITHIQTVDELRGYIHATLCQKENLLAEQFALRERVLRRQDAPCGMQFSIHGPRSVRLAAIWEHERNTVYFYDARGNRFSKVRLASRVEFVEADAA
jgi:hypothetical protein